MKTDDFEKRLQRQPQREIPAAWREEILTTAQSNFASPHAPRVTHHGFALSTIIHQLSTLLRPRRAAWAGLGAAWAIIITLHLATVESPKTTLTTAASAPATPETLQVLKQQRLLYAELVGRPETQPMDRLKTSVPGPRSQRREDTASV